VNNQLPPPPFPPPPPQPPQYGYPPQGESSDGVVKWLIPLDVTVWAVIAGYLALFAVLIVPAPFALGAGLIARRDLRRRPDRRGKGRATFAIVTGGLFTIPFVLIVVLLIGSLFVGE
jgi:hypothetical protein